jgi:hypothetical protein
MPARTFSPTGTENCLFADDLSAIIDENIFSELVFYVRRAQSTAAFAAEGSEGGSYLKGVP